MKVQKKKNLKTGLYKILQCLESHVTEHAFYRPRCTISFLQ